jgi:hypothetical protein
MALVAQFNGDILVSGTLILGGTIVLPANVVGNYQVSAGSPLDTTKTLHRFLDIYEQKSTATVVADQHVVHRTYSAQGGQIITFQAGCITPCVGTDSIIVNLLQNGVSISVLTLTSSQTAYQTVVGSLNTTNSAQGDVFEVSVAVNHVSGTMGLGIFAQFGINEQP